MTAWKQSEFGEIAEFPPKISLTKGEEYSFIPMEDLNSGYKYVGSNQTKVWSGSGGAKFESGDTLFARITPCLQNGKIAQAKDLKHGRGFGSTEYFIFRGIKNISDSDFIYYLSTTEEFRKYAIGSMVGASGRQRADAKFVSKYTFNCPPLPIQQRIASILSAYDDLIENNLKRIKLLEELAQRTYEEWFVKFRINGEQLPIDENTGLPFGWYQGTFKDLISFQSGFAYKSSKFISEGNPIIKIKNINNNFVELNDTDFIDDDYASTTKKFELKSGDLLIAMTGATVGKVGFVPIWNKPLFLNQRVGRFIIKGEINNSMFVFAAMNQGNGLQQVMNLAGGAAQPNISGDQILSIKSIIPDKTILNKYSYLTNPIIDQILKLRRKNECLKNSRDILLPRLMNGTIKIDEP